MPKKKFTKQEIAEFKAIFKNFDIDEDGAISIQDLKTVMTRLGLPATTPEVSKLIRAAAKKKKDTVKFKQFLKVVEKITPPPNEEEEIKAMFRAFDKTNKGYIEARRVDEVMTELGISIEGGGLEVMLQAAEADTNGRITYAKFKYMYQRIFKKQKKEPVAGPSKR